MLWPYALKAFEEQLNTLKVDDDLITSMDNLEVTTTDITIKNHHIWVCPVYVLDEIFQDNISGIPKWEIRSLAGIYIGHSPFHEVLVTTVINPATGHVSHQFDVVFDDEFFTGPFMGEGTILPN